MRWLLVLALVVGAIGWVCVHFDYEYFLFFVLVFVLLYVNMGFIQKVVSIFFVGDAAAGQGKLVDYSCDVAPYTVMIPLYKEAGVVRETIRSMERINYPKSLLQVLLIVEEDDLETKNSIPDDIPEFVTLVELPKGQPRTKARALNYGLGFCVGKYVAIYDAEDRPDSDQLYKALHAFSGGAENIWAYQARISIRNKDINWISCFYFSEYEYWYCYYLPFLHKCGLPLPLSGTSNHFKTSVLSRLNGWDEFNVTEDAELAVRIYKNGGRVGLMDSETWGRSPTKIKNWIRQRTRWIKGFLVTFFTHAQHDVDLVLMVYFLLCYSGVFLVVNSIIIVGLLFAINDVDIRFASLVLCNVFFIASVCFSYLVVFYLGGLKMVSALRGILFPGVVGYWVIYLIANVRAIYQFFVCPYDWEKTDNSENG